MSDDVFCGFQSSNQNLETEKNKAEAEIENRKLELNQKLQELSETQQNLAQLQSELIKVNTVCKFISEIDSKVFKNEETIWHHFDLCRKKK